MAGIVFPDVAGSVLPAIQIQQKQTQDALAEARQRKLDADQARLDSAGQYIQGAVNGDPEAAANLARTNPVLFGHVQTLITSRDDKKLKQAQENAKWLAGASGAVLEAPPEERATAYAQHLAELDQRGIPRGPMPATYSPAADAYLRYHLNSGVSADKYLETHLNTPQPMAGGGSTPGGPPVPGSLPGGASPEQQQQFIQAMTPHALAVAQQTGQDPRLVLAQAALETGYGQHAPGNNYFGIKGGNGPALQTKEAGPGGQLVPTQAQFRSYRGPGESATDYANLISTDPHYEGVRSVIQNGGDLSAQIDAMGKSGYATDPNYAGKLRQIAFGLPTPSNQQPTMGAVPPQMAAYGRNAAPMPNVAPAQVGAVPGNPVAMPQPGGAYRTASGATVDPSIPPPAFMGPQGGDQPPVNQPGVMPQPAAPPPPNVMDLQQYVDSVRPGHKVMGIPKTGLPVYDHNGYVAVAPPGWKPGDAPIYIPGPPKVEQTPSGYRALSNGNLEAIPGGPADLTRKYGEGIPPELADVHGDAFRNSPFWQQKIGVEDRNNVEGLLSGNTPISMLAKRAGSGAGGAGGLPLNRLIGLAQQIDPNWSPNEGVQKAKWENQTFADSNSKNYQARQAINIAPEHAVDLVKITDAINQQNPQAVQNIVNKLKQQFGDTAVPDMNAARNLVALEFLRAAVGPAALNQSLEKAFIESIPTGATSDQVRRIIGSYVDKLQSRANEMQDTGDAYGSTKKIISPRTQEALDYLKGPKRDAQGAPVAPTPSMWDRVFGGASTPHPNAPANSQDTLRKKYGLE